MLSHPPVRSNKAGTSAKRKRSKSQATTKGEVVPPASKVKKPEVRIFVSYSHADAAARAKLETHLAALKRDGVSTWFDDDMNAGDALDTNIARALRRAHLFIALLSPEYLDSRYCWKLEYQRAMNRRARGTLRVLAAVVRPCDWKATQAAGFKLLPRDGRPVTRWRSADEAFLDIAEGIRGVVRVIRQNMVEAPVKLPGTPRAANARTASGGARRSVTKTIKEPAQRQATVKTPRRS